MQLHPSGVPHSNLKCAKQKSTPFSFRQPSLARRPGQSARAFKDWFSSFVPQRPQQAPQEQLELLDRSGLLDQQQLQPGQQQPYDTPLATALAQQPQPARPTPQRDFLEARQVSLYSLFDSSEYVFDIPAYQRPYAWRPKQVYELLQDFLKAYHAREEYFLGAVVATRAADGPHAPFQLIDGQQRLTTLCMMLAALRHWAQGRPAAAAAAMDPPGADASPASPSPASQPPHPLGPRLARMLHLEADPLDPASSARYRLKLRDADDAFFRANVLDAFLPTPYRLELAGEAAGAEEGQEGAEGAGALPLSNETHWRLYEAASFLGGQLAEAEAAGVNLQDFAFHVLRSCFVVVMLARDESASFRIFACLNGRGMDLTEVDKLKAELLQELSPAERSHFADAWGAMEASLGRAAFHGVFTHMRDLAAVSDPWVGATPVLEYFGRRSHDPRAVKQVLQVALDYARLLLQLRQAAWAPPAPAETEAEVEAAAEALTPVAEEAAQGQGQQAASALSLEGAYGAADVAAAAALGSSGALHAAAAAVARDEQTVSAFAAAAAEGGALGVTSTSVEQHDTAPTAPTTATPAAALSQPQPAAASGPALAALLAELSARSRYLALFEDTAWLPPLLEFCYQAEDPALRAEFMKRAEALQLYLELDRPADPPARAARWARVSRALLARPLDPAAVLGELALTPQERAAFRARLDSKDLYGSVEERTLRHLLIRAEPAAVMLPQLAAGAGAAEGGGFRLEKVVPQIPPEGSLWRKTRIASAADPDTEWPPLGYRPQPPPAAAAPDTPAPAPPSPSPSASSEPAAEDAAAASTSATPTPTPTPNDLYDVRYWYDVQRLGWHAKLGNLVLLPAAATSAAAGLAGADYDTKAAAWAAAGVAARLPGFTGPVAAAGAGRYGRFRFCFDECRQRHADLVERLAAVYEL